MQASTFVCMSHFVFQKRRFGNKSKGAVALQTGWDGSKETNDRPVGAIAHFDRAKLDRSATNTDCS